MPFLARKNPSMNTEHFHLGTWSTNFKFCWTSSFAGRLGLFDVQEIRSERQNRFEFFQKEDRYQKRIHYITYVINYNYILYNIFKVQY